jgi:hypothetical protein
LRAATGFAAAPARFVAGAEIEPRFAVSVAALTPAVCLPVAFGTPLALAPVAGRPAATSFVLRAVEPAGAAPPPLVLLRCDVVDDPPRAAVRALPGVFLSAGVFAIPHLVWLWPLARISRHVCGSPLIQGARIRVLAACAMVEGKVDLEAY